MYIYIHIYIYKCITPNYDAHVVLSSASRRPVKSNEWDFRRSNSLCWEGLCDPPGAARRAWNFWLRSLWNIETYWDIWKHMKTYWNHGNWWKLVCQFSELQPVLQSGSMQMWPGAHTAGAVWSAEQPFGMSFEWRRLAKWLIHADPMSIYQEAKPPNLKRFTSPFRLDPAEDYDLGVAPKKLPGAKELRRFHSGGAKVTTLRRWGIPWGSDVPRKRPDPFDPFEPGWWMPGKQMPCFLDVPGCWWHLVRQCGLLPSAVDDLQSPYMMAMPGAEVSSLKVSALVCQHHPDW